MRDKRTAEELSIEMEEKIKYYFGNKAIDFRINNINNYVYTSFNIDFLLYSFFHIVLSYENDRFGCSICTGGKGIYLDNSQTKYSTADFNMFFKEIDEQVRLRIPDKYLAYYNL